MGVDGHAASTFTERTVWNTHVDIASGTRELRSQTVQMHHHGCELRCGCRHEYHIEKSRYKYRAVESELDP